MTSDPHPPREAKVDGGRWTVDGGRWTVDGGRWTVDGGRWTVDGGRWTVEGGRRTVDDGTSVYVCRSRTHTDAEFTLIDGRQHTPATCSSLHHVSSRWIDIKFGK